MILGVVLAGGQSSRFGSNKALALWQGRPLIEHVRARLQTVTTNVIISDGTGIGPDRIADRPGPGLGPLGGLAAALHHASQHGFGRVISAPCDTPILDDDLLLTLASTNGDAFVAALPLIGSWQTGQGPELEALLGQPGNRSFRHWASLIGAEALNIPPPPNINEQADLQAICQLKAES